MGLFGGQKLVPLPDPGYHYDDPMSVQRGAIVLGP